MQPSKHAKYVASDSLQTARRITLLLVVVTAGLSLSSVHYLSRIVSHRRTSLAANATHDGGWHDMILLVEHNIESHLPHQLADQLAEVGVGQHPQGLDVNRNLVEMQRRHAGAGVQIQDAGAAAGADIATAAATKLPVTLAPRAAERKQKSDQRSCNMEEHTEYAMGIAVRWGSTNKVDSWEECCEQCLEFVPSAGSDKTCNAWVWCGDETECRDQYQECWLKHFIHPEAVAPAQGPHVPWTGGFLEQPLEQENEEEEDVSEESGDDRSFHVIITAEGSATHWQCRLHYYWYRKTKARCEKLGNCQMGGFTRILHSGKADDLMQEMPTFVAQPLPRDKHDHKGYVVLNRPYSIKQWVERAEIKEKYVLMSEPDHVWLKPMPNLMKNQHPAAFPFFYISPSTPELNLRLTHKYTGNISQKEAEKIAPIGNAPTMMSFTHLKQVAPTWMNLSLAIFHDEETAKEWGWVQEMYAFTIACYNEGVPKVHLHKKMMSQPPWDSEIEPFYLLHFTYGMDYTKKGVFTPGKYGEWRFDKRTYAALPPPRHLGEPPPGMSNKLVRHLIHAINEASTVIPGWDEYAATGVVKEVWDGVLPQE